ncbi:MAG: serine hydrolase domain-containing protein [Henriciella sp.]|nr:serine hydrolase domain-containing protein [Henriciella sp.]
MFKWKPLAALALACAGLSACAVETSAPVIATQPTEEAFDPAPVDQFLSSAVEANRTVGMSALIYFEGEEIYFGAQGFADREAARPMARDTLVNIYSMTKPVTGVTLMTLYEDGLFELDDPLSDYLPEFADARVFKGVNADGSFPTEPVNRPITVMDVMRHTAGLGYGWEGGPLAEAMVEKDLFNPDSTLEQFSQDVASLPLFFQPGTRWQYSIGVDIQARLAEVLSGQPFEELMHERVLDPLGMSETGFHAPNDQKARVSAIYVRDEDGNLEREPDELVYGFAAEAPSLTMGGSGLVSTLDDYMTFALMLQNEGTHNGAEILKPETIALMATDHLPAEVEDRAWLPTKGQVGFGIDFAVRVAPQASPEENAGTVGEFFWDGRGSTLFWVDPARDITVVFFTQIVPFDSPLQTDFRAAVYDAFPDPE